MKILVTGATGFVGAACANELAHAGHDVVRGTRRTVTAPLQAENWLNHGDLTHPVDWPRLLSGFDAIVHCAGLASVSGEDAEARANAVNVAATANLAEGAAQAGVRRFVFLSSALAGAQSIDSHYARSKLDGERRIEDIAARSGMAWVILRPPMVYGSQASGNFARLLAMVRRGLPLPLGCATAEKSFIGIDNLASAVSAAVTHDAAADKKFFVADAEKSSTAGLVRKIAVGLNRPARLMPIPMSAMRLLGRATGKEREIRSLFDPLTVDISSIQNTLDWKPPLTFDQGIMQAVAGSDAAQKSLHPMKRALDVIASLAGLALTWPIMALAMLAVRAETPGAPLFQQVRLGQYKKPFTLYKIRSMHTGVKNDATHMLPVSAITRVGRFLRRSKIDELPQLINVLRGDMSLVGPRPCLPSQSALIEARERLGVFDLRPGMTGLAQVRGIDMSDAERLAAIDLEYKQTATTTLDLKLIAATALGQRLIGPL